LRVGITTSAEPPGRTEGAAEYLQAASHSSVSKYLFPVISIRSACADRSLDRVRNDLFGASYCAMIGLRLVRLCRVIHFGVEIPWRSSAREHCFSLPGDRCQRALLIDGISFSSSLLENFAPSTLLARGPSVTSRSRGSCSSRHHSCPAHCGRPLRCPFLTRNFRMRSVRPAACPT